MAVGDETSEQPLHALLIEDYQDDVEVMRRLAGSSRLRVRLEHVSDGAAAISLLGARPGTTTARRPTLCC
jgi:hypothetical protein